MKKRGIRNKKALEMAVNTIIIIVLSVLVLIVLIFIFNQQTGIFSNFINNLVGRTNVDSVVTACNSLTASNSVYEYCCVEKEVRHSEDRKTKEEKLTCQELAEKSFTGGRINKINCESAGC